MEGLLIRGTLVKLEEPDDGGGFANVTVESHRPSGEPKWTRAAFPMTKQGSTEQTAIARDLIPVEVGSLVELAVESRVSAAGRSWTKAYAVEVVAGPSGEGAGRAKRTAPLAPAGRR